MSLSSHMQSIGFLMAWLYYSFGIFLMAVITKPALVYLEIDTSLCNMQTMHIQVVLKLYDFFFILITNN